MDVEEEKELGSKELSQTKKRKAKENVGSHSTARRLFQHYTTTAAWMMLKKNTFLFLTRSERRGSGGYFGKQSNEKKTQHVDNTH